MYNEAWNKYIEEKSEELLTKEQLQAMIDFVLDLKPEQKEWFLELTERLKGME